MSPSCLHPHPASPTSPRSQSSATEPSRQPAAETVLCHHCGRTSSNGIVCQGMCVADSDY